MKNRITEQLEETNGRRVDISAQGVHDGSQGVDPQYFLAGIEALHSKLEAKLRELVESTIRTLEAHARTLAHLEEQANKHWEQLRQNHLADPPQLLFPLFMLMVGLFALSADSILLAPTLDMMGVTEPLLQIFLAFAFGIVAAILFHLGLEAQHKVRPLKWFLRVTSGVMLMGLSLLGAWRAKELAFSASATGNPLGQFLASHPILSVAVISMFNVLFPLCGALAIHYAVSQASLWLQFRRTQQRAEALKRELDLTQKQIESENNQLQHQVEALRQRCEEWKADYRNHWNLGNERGVAKGPIWRVWAKAIGTGLAFSLLCLLAMVFLGTNPHWLIISLVGLCVGLLSGVHFYRQWAHPDPEELMRRVNIQFRGDGPRTPRPVTYGLSDESNRARPVPKTRQPADPIEASTQSGNGRCLVALPTMSCKEDALAKEN